MSAKLTRYNWIQIKMILVAVILASVLGVVLWRSYELQMVQEGRFDARSANQVKRKQTVTGRRGSIRDRNGVELAVTVSKPSLYANPRFIKDKEGTLQHLQTILGEELDEERVRKRLFSKRSKVYIARKIRPELAEDVLALGIRGISVEVEHQRYYPLKDLAGHILGVVTTREDKETRIRKDVGLEGIERRFDKTLQGRAVTLDMLQDAWRRRMYIGDSPDYNALEGNTVVTSLDERIQYIVETELAHGVRRFRAKSGTAILSNPKTGEILAMATSTREAPHFNPNRRNDTPLTAMRNRTITDPFEPGSTFKPFVLAAAMQEGAVRPNDTIDTEGGAMKIGDYTTYDITKAQRLKAWEVIKYSSNIGAYKIAKRLGKERLGRYVKLFGFGERSKIELSGEARGRVSNWRRWSDRILASTAYGYGQMVTNLQLNMALSTIANGGLLMEPRLVREVRDREGKVLEMFPPKAKHRVLDEKVASDVASVMSSVLEEGGTGTRAALAYYKVAGKTGTARKVNPRTRRYDKSLIVASFIGFAPVEDPSMTLTIIIDEPRLGRGGGEVAAPIFRRIAEQVLPLLNVFPDNAKQVSVLDAYKEKQRSLKNPPGSALPSRRRRRLTRNAAKDAPARFPVPEYTNNVHAPDVSASLQPMPSYLGMSLREVLSTSQNLGHTVRVEGAGVVEQQWPSPGVFVGDNVSVFVRLKSRDLELPEPNGEETRLLDTDEPPPFEP